MDASGASGSELRRALELEASLKPPGMSDTQRTSRPPAAIKSESILRVKKLEDPGVFSYLSLFQLEEKEGESERVLL